MELTALLILWIVLRASLPAPTNVSFTFFAASNVLWFSAITKPVATLYTQAKARLILGLASLGIHIPTFQSH